MGQHSRVVIGLAFALAAVPAQAANHGFYASVDAGAVDQEISGPFTAVPLGGILGLGGPQTPDQSPDIGWALFGAAGMRFDGPFRIEAELGYRASTLSSISDIDHLTVMANVLYDLQLTHGLSLMIGGGAGVDRISWSGSMPLPPAFTDQQFTDDTWQFAVQGILGASMMLSDRAALDLKYRYMVPTGAKLEGLNARGSNGMYEFTGDDVSTHTLSLGLTFQLD